MANEAAKTSRRTFASAAALAWMGGGSAGAQPARRPPRMKITKVEPILTGSDVFLKVETDAGITGYGDATNHFLPYASAGTLKDIIPYLIGEDPERIEYLWQSAFRRRFYRGGPATGAAVSAIDMALWDIKGKAYGVPVYQLLGGLARTKVRVYGHVTGNTAIGIGAAVTRRPLPHHRTYGSVYGGSRWLRRHCFEQ